MTKCYKYTTIMTETATRAWDDVKSITRAGESLLNGHLTSQ